MSKQHIYNAFIRCKHSNQSKGKNRNNFILFKAFLSHLHFERSPLDLCDAFLDDEGNALHVTLQDLREIAAEELQTTLELLMTTLDGQRLQTLLMTRQETLDTQTHTSSSLILSDENKTGTELS